MKTSQRLLCWIGAASLAGALSVFANQLVVKGQVAPLFSGEDQDGGHWKLADHIGKSVVFLYFYPKDDTAGCTAEACGLRDNMSELNRQGVEVVGVSFDDKDSHKDFIFKYGLDFPLLADTNGMIADAYGARKDDLKMDRRVSFVIGLDGRVLRVTDSPSPAEHIRGLADAMAALHGKASH
ncbi:MAG TPA: peroxiredoxin [Verrucomicrobiae bacterium]|jgi:peroxiredoxin Q/BCP